MTNHYATIRAALERATGGRPSNIEAAQEALSALAELERMAGEPSCTIRTTSGPISFYAAPPIPKGMFTAAEMERAWRDAYEGGVATEKMRENSDFWWPRSDTFKLIQERTA